MLCGGEICELKEWLAYGAAVAELLEFSSLRTQGTPSAIPPPAEYKPLEYFAPLSQEQK